MTPSSSSSSIDSADTTLPAASECFVGIDVSLEQLDVARADLTEQRWSFANDAKGIAQLLELLITWQPTRIAVESTGKIERAVLFALIDARLNACHVNPMRVRRFAQADGILAKTDRIDALVLARYAQLMGPRIASAKPANQLELAELVTCRRQLVESRTAHLNQIKRVHSKFALSQLQQVVRQLEKRIEKLEAEIARLIENDDDMNQADRIIRSFTGAGAVLSATLLAHLFELGRIGHAPLAALVGVAPFNDDSGRHKGQRRITGGRVRVRNVVYVCTICALRCNPVIKTKYKQLLARGKAKKVAIIACARKMLRILNAMLRDQTCFHLKNKNPVTGA